MGESLLPRRWPKPARSPDGPTKGGNYLIVGVVLVIAGTLLSLTSTSALVILGRVLVYVGAIVGFIGCVAIGVRIGITDARPTPSQPDTGTDVQGQAPHAAGPDSA